MGKGDESPREGSVEPATDPSAPATAAAGEKPAGKEELSRAQAAKLAEESWMRVGPLRFPPWTSTAVLAAIPVQLLAAAITGAIAGERAALQTLTVSLFALFLVIALWVDTGRSLGSLARAVLTAAGLALVVSGVLGGVTVLSERTLANDGGTKGQANLKAMTQDEADRADLAGGGLAGRDISGLRFDRRDMEKARLDGAIAIGTHFAGAWLKGASMRGAVLTGAVLTGACVDRLDLRGATLDGADFRGVDVRQVDVNPSQLGGVAAWPTPQESAASGACAETERPRR